MENKQKVNKNQLIRIGKLCRNTEKDPAYYYYVNGSPFRRVDITVLPADKPKQLRLGWTIQEEIGLPQFSWR
jgi:hypothetical protein